MLVACLEERRVEGLFDPLLVDFDPGFHAVNFVSNQQLLDELTWIEGQIANAVFLRKLDLLHRFMCVEQPFSEQKAMRCFGQDLAVEAKAH
ncbi:MAG: hypothetical protein ACN6OP_13925 [Pseudomonadales bacterium]